MQLLNQVAVVTGGANGIGRALCRRFAAEQARGVVVSDIDFEAASAVAAEIGGFAVHCDVSREAEVQSLVAQTIERFGQIDLFVSNAGITTSGGIEVPNADWQRLWDVNVMAHVYAARAVLPGMLARGQGYLLHTSSAAGLLTEIGSAPYSVTKHAVVAFAEWLSVQYQRRGIKVSCLCPAGVSTDFLDLSDPVHQFLHMSSVTPEAVADCVIEGLATDKFLLSPHKEVEEFFQFKTQHYDAWLKNFSRVHEKMEKAKAKGLERRNADAS
jgi:NAD(P)-dependent dehydrogenase (short-subunit alcohol dehydrogenase family)